MSERPVAGWSIVWYLLYCTLGIFIILIGDSSGLVSKHVYDIWLEVGYIWPYVFFFALQDLIRTDWVIVGLAYGVGLAIVVCVGLLAQKLLRRRVSEGWRAAVWALGIWWPPLLIFWICAGIILQVLGFRPVE